MKDGNPLASRVTQLPISLLIVILIMVNFTMARPWLQRSEMLCEDEVPLQEGQNGLGA